MKKTILAAWIACTISSVWPAFAQVKQTKEQILFYTSQWKGERFADGRPKVADDLLTRALDVSLEDVWEYLGSQGYTNQFEGGWLALHIEKPFAGRALTAQFAPRRPDMAAAVAAEGKAEGRVSGTNSWVINELQMGDTMVADGYGKIIEGTLIGSNLGSGIAAHTHSGFIFNAGIRDAEEMGSNAAHRHRRSGPYRTRCSVAGRPGACQNRWSDLYSRDPGGGGDRQGRIHQSARCLQF
jgi:hypothetical protein